MNLFSGHFVDHIADQERPSAYLFHPTMLNHQTLANELLSSTGSSISKLSSPSPMNNTSNMHSFQQPIGQHQQPTSHHHPPHHHHHPQRNPFIGRSQCVVCGDRARGCNFGAITCASCKEFFRRNAFKLNKLKCYFQSKCEITLYSRRFCAACRLAKCYLMGMKSEYIMSDAEKHERNMKIIERRLNSKDPMVNGSLLDHNHKTSIMTNNEGVQMPQTTSIDYESSSDESKPNGTFLNPYSPEFNYSVDLGYFDNIVDYYKHNDNNNNLPTSEPSNGKQSKCISEKDIIKNHHHHHQNNNNTMEDPDAVIKLLKKVKIIRESSYSVNKFRFFLLAKDIKLNEHGSCKLKYLTSIVQIFSAEIFSDLPTNQQFINLVDVAEIVTYNFIKMCKKLQVFQALTHDDQVALVKGSVMDTLMIWTMMTINLEKECWEALDLERNFRFSLKMNMEMLKEANPKLYEKHRSYVMSFEPEWRYDDNLMSLLIVIALFNPERPNLSNVEMISTERENYCSLLKNYLSTLYEKSTSNDMYQRLLNQLKSTEQISEYHKKTYFDLSANEATKKCFGGLVIEITPL